MTKKNLERAALTVKPSTKRRLLEVIHCLAGGLNHQQAAQTLGISLNGMKIRCNRLREYFGAATTLEAVLIARREWNLDL